MSILCCYLVFSSRDTAAVGQADPESMLPGEQPHRENSGGGARVDGQARGGGAHTVIALYLSMQSVKYSTLYTFVVFFMTCLDL